MTDTNSAAGFVGSTAKGGPHWLRDLAISVAGSLIAAGVVYALSNRKRFGGLTVDKIMEQIPAWLWSILYIVGVPLLWLLCWLWSRSLAGE